VLSKLEVSHKQTERRDLLELSERACKNFDVGDQIERKRCS
jgi:hypothetical protein